MIALGKKAPSGPRMPHSVRRIGSSRAVLPEQAGGCEALRTFGRTTERGKVRLERVLQFGGNPLL